MINLSRNLSRIAFRFTFWMGIFFIPLSFMAMLFYPGGTVHNHSAETYLFFENFFSDLGRTIGFREESNLISCLLFNGSLSLLGIGMVFLFFSSVSLFPEDKWSRIISWSMSFLGIISGLCFLGIALTPWDLYYTEHVFFVKIGFRLLLFSCILWAVNIYRTSYYPNLFAHAISMISVVLFAYILLLTFGPSPKESQEGLMIQVAGQKIIVYLLISGIIILSKGAEKVRKQLSPTS